MRKHTNIILTLVALFFLIATGISIYLFIIFDSKILTYVSLGVAFFSIILATIFVMVLISKKYLKKIKGLEDQVDTLNNSGYHIKEAGDIAFNNLPIAILVYDMHYRITWGNTYAKQIFKTNFLNDDIIAMDINLYNKLKDNNQKFLYKKGDDYYDVTSYPDSNLLFFFPATEREKLQQKYNARTTTIGIIKIDNLDESLNIYSVQEASQIRGEFLGVISDLAQNYKASLQKIDDDKMLFITNKASLELIVQNKFECLNQIRDIANRNHLKTSMSMGFACYDKSSSEVVSLAQSAVDLAERRGGDQAVINIEGEEIKYFGGKIDALEKESRVKESTNARELKSAIQKANSIYITGHKFPDADCIGSMLGVLRMVLSIKNNVHVVLDSKNIDRISARMLSLLEEKEPEIFEHFVSIDEVDIKKTEVDNESVLLVICDTQGPNIMCYPELYKLIGNRFVIDHHRAGEPAFENCKTLYVDTGASSAVELICEMLPFFNKDLKFSEYEATLMLAGIVIDTNNFVSNTRTRTFEVASVLKNVGADMMGVRKLIRDTFDIEKLVANAFVKAEIYEDEFAISKLDDITNDRTLLARISDKLITIDNIKASFTIALNSSGVVCVSARSIDDFNVQVIMEELGGGGHKNAAATQIQNTSINEVYDKLKKILYIEKISNTEDDVTVEVILLEDVKGKGKKDTIIKVANGYANYLINSKLAVPATDENKKSLDAKKAEDEQIEQNKIKTHERLKKEIDGKSIDVYIKFGQDGKAFGHITTKQICDEFEAQTGIHLDKKKVSVPQDINFIGKFKATVNLYKDINASFDVNVLEMR